MDGNLNSMQTMPYPPSRKKLRASSYLADAELDREWERRHQQASLPHDSESSESKEPLS